MDRRCSDVEPNSEFEQQFKSGISMRINLIFAGAAHSAKSKFGERNELFSGTWVHLDEMWMRMVASCCWEMLDVWKNRTSCWELLGDRDVYTLFNYYWQSIITFHIVAATPSMRVEHTHRLYTLFKLAIGGASPICRLNTTTTDIWMEIFLKNRLNSFLFVSVNCTQCATANGSDTRQHRNINKFAAGRKKSFEGRGRICHFDIKSIFAQRRFFFLIFFVDKANFFLVAKNVDEVKWSQASGFPPSFSLRNLFVCVFLRKLLPSVCVRQ